MDDVYKVPFLGETIDCRTGLDAVAVKLADSVLTGREDVNPAELHRLAAILDHYGRPVAAQRLRAQRLHVI
jgi:hypothetical protein